MGLNVSLHSSQVCANFPTVSTRIVTILSSDDILADLLINLLSVVDGRIVGNYYWLRDSSGFPDYIFLLEYLSLSELLIIDVDSNILQCLIHLPLVIIIIANQSLQLQSLSHLQEPVQLLLVDLNLSLVDVVQDKLELPRGDSVKTEERMGVFVVSEDMFEVRTGG